MKPERYVFSLLFHLSLLATHSEVWLMDPMAVLPLMFFMKLHPVLPSDSTSVSSHSVYRRFLSLHLCSTYTLSLFPQRWGNTPLWVELHFSVEDKWYGMLFLIYPLGIWVYVLLKILTLVFLILLNYFLVFPKKFAGLPYKDYLNCQTVQKHSFLDFYFVNGNATLFSSWSWSLCIVCYPCILRIVTFSSLCIHFWKLPSVFSWSMDYGEAVSYFSQSLASGHLMQCP